MTTPACSTAVGNALLLPSDLVRRWPFALPCSDVDDDDTGPAACKSCPAPTPAPPSTSTPDCTRLPGFSASGLVGKLGLARAGSCVGLAGRDGLFGDVDDEGETEEGTGMWECGLDGVADDDAEDDADADADAESLSERGNRDDTGRELDLAVDGGERALAAGSSFCSKLGCRGVG